MKRSESFCAIQGAIDSVIRLPDGKLISEKFHLVYVDRDRKGIYRLRLDSLGWIDSTEASNRLDRELSQWASDKSALSKLSERRDALRAWINDQSGMRETYEGFRVQREGYEVSFSFFSIGPNADECRYCYEVRLRDSVAKVDDDCWVRRASIQKSKRQWAATRGKGTNENVTVIDLVRDGFPWVSGQLCPGGGQYKLGALGEFSSCSLSEHSDSGTP